MGLQRQYERHLVANVLGVLVRLVLNANLTLAIYLYGTTENRRYIINFMIDVCRRPLHVHADCI